MKIYLDLNVYHSISERENLYDYTLAKINNLHKASVSFPHSPAHAEELFAQSRRKETSQKALRTINLIEKYNNHFGYTPGKPNEQEAFENMHQFDELAKKDHSFKMESWKMLLHVKAIREGIIDEKEYSTQLIRETLNDCMLRVEKLIHYNDTANFYEIYEIGRRNDKSMLKNFSDMNIMRNGEETFEEIHRKFHIGPRRLANIDPEEIFSDKHLIKYAEYFFSKFNLDYHNIPSPEVIKKSHHKKEKYISRIMDMLETGGYYQEDKNHQASIIGRMHDVTHSIYASQADYFVTNDSRLRRKTVATYKKLGISTEVLDIPSFLTLNFTNK